MKRLREVAVFGIISLCFLLETGCALGQKNARTFYVLQDEGNDRWCLYKNREEWSKAVDSLGAMTVGALMFENDIVVNVEFTETDETGDWVVYDKYYLDTNHITKITRLINNLSDNTSTSQTYVIVNGHIVKRSQETKDLDTGKLSSSNQPSWMPEVELWKNLYDSPMRYFVNIKEITKNVKCMNIS